MKYLSVFNNTAEGIFLTTPMGTYLDDNPALAQICGFSSTQDLITHCKNIKQELYVDPKRRDEFTRILKDEKEITGFQSQVRKGRFHHLGYRKCQKLL